METILVVDDEAEVRSLARDILEDSGYTVLEAASGEEALRLAEAHPHPIHLLLTDIVMPGINGGQLAERLRVLRRETKILYMSAHTSEVVGDYGVRVPSDSFIAKPFSVERLLGKIREKFDRQSPFKRPGPGRP